jgi:hypothetical protein
MKKPFRALVSFFRLSAKQKKELIQIIIIYFRVSCLIRYSPLSKYYDKYFLHDSKDFFDFMPYRAELKLIQKVIKHMPGKHTCLKESLVVHLSFKRKGLFVPLYLGVNTENEFLAHAWYDQHSSKGYSQLNGS